MPSYVASRRPRSSKTAGRGGRKGSMRQQLKPKTAKQLEAEERRLKRFDSDSEESGPDNSIPERVEVQVEPENSLDISKEVEEDEEDETLEESELVAELGSDVKEDVEEDSEGDSDEEEVTENEEDDFRDAEDSDANVMDSEKEEADELEEDDIESDSKVENKEVISGWADSIAKILSSTKPKNKKEMMLSRARKDYEVSKISKTGSKPSHPQDNLEVIQGTKSKSAEDSAEKVEKKPQVDDGVLSLKVQRKLELKQKKLERAWENLARLNTEKSEPEVERDLLKIATKGVVQLFNAIAMQQKTMKSKMRNGRQSEFQKEKILNQTKDIFDSSMSKSKLMGDGTALNNDIKIKEEGSDEDVDRNSRIKRKSSENSTRNSKKKPVWNALQDDFMLDAKLKDWDQNSDSD